MKLHNHSDENHATSENIFETLAFDDDEPTPTDKPASSQKQRASSVPPTRTSVDTIHLMGPFKVPGELSPEFTVEHSYMQRKDICLYIGHEDSRSVYYIGRRAKASRGGICVLIEPLYEGSQESVCKISFSAPRVLFGTNEQILSPQQCEQVFERVEETLRDWGIEMDVRAAKLVGVDVLRHMPMNRPAICHVNVLHYLTIKHSTHTLNYPTSITRGNESTQLHIYDKGAEMKKKGRDPRQIAPISSEHKRLLKQLHEGTILRVEWRLRNTETIRKELGVSTVGDFLKRFDFLDSWLIRKMKDNLFREATPYDVEDLIGKPPMDRPTAQQRSQFLANMLRGTALAVKRTLQFEALEYRMRPHDKKGLNRTCMPGLREMCSGPRPSAEFAKLQSELRKTMLWGLSVDGIPYAALYEELKRITDSPRGWDWTQPRPTGRKPRKPPRNKVQHTPSRRR